MMGNMDNITQFEFRHDEHGWLAIHTPTGSYAPNPQRERDYFRFDSREQAIEGARVFGPDVHAAS